MEMLKAFKAAAGVGVPLVIIRTPDPASTEKTIVEAKLSDDGKYIDNETGKERERKPQLIPIIHWDVMRGLVGLNPTGKQVLDGLPKDKQGNSTAAQIKAPVDMLLQVMRLPRFTIFFMSNAHLFWDNPRSKEEVRQGIWNLRDPFKANGRMFICLTSAGSVIPTELAQDVLVLDEPFPNEEDLQKIGVQVITDARAIYPKLPEKPDKETLRRFVDATIGLSAFVTEQSGAMSIGPNGFNFNELAERKRQVVEQTRGFSISREKQEFSDIAGCDNAKKYFSALIRGRKPFDGVVFIDEIEKHFAGVGTDLSGVTTKQTGFFLGWMEDHKAAGSLFIGHPGCAKTYFGRSIGNEAGVPTINLDFAAMESGIVGSSGEFLRSGMKMVDAMFKRPLFIGTCNGWGQMPTALRRRFYLTTFFFDLLSNEEREVAWALWIKNFGLVQDQSLPPDRGWTGAEIRNCCDTAYRLNIPLEEAGKYIVPVCESDPSGIQELREQASNKFVSASYDGKYKLPKNKDDDPVYELSQKSGVKRAFRLTTTVEEPGDGEENETTKLPAVKVPKDRTKYDS